MNHKNKKPPDKKVEELGKGLAYLILEVVVIILLYMFTRGWVWLVINGLLVLRTWKEFLFWYWDLTEFIEDKRLATEEE